MDQRIEFYKAAFSQRSNGFDIPVFRGTSKYQYGQGLGDVLCNMVRFIPRVAQLFKPVAIKGVQTFLKARSEAIKEGATVKDVIKSTPRPTVGAVLGAMVTMSPLSLLKCEITQTTHLHLIRLSSCLSFSRRLQIISDAVDLYIRRHLNVLSIHPNIDQLFIIFKMAINGNDVPELITCEVDLFESNIQQNVIENNFNREYAPLQLSNQIWPLNLRLRIQMTYT